MIVQARINARVASGVSEAEARRPILALGLFFDKTLISPIAKRYRPQAVRMTMPSQHHELTRRGVVQPHALQYMACSPVQGKIWYY